MMKHSKSRPLAYAMAQTIALEELDTISGGRGGFGPICTKESLRASGNNARNLDVVLDFITDF